MIKKCGVVYILTNPSFPQYVKIGYSDNVDERLKSLNSKSALPYSFRIYATYDVFERLQDRDVQDMIDQINPSLRCVEEINGKKREREFFAMSAEAAYSILNVVAKLSGTTDRLHLYTITDKEQAEEEQAEEDRELDKNRFHFKEISFSSSLTGKKYYSKANPITGALSVYEADTGIEVESFSRPSKKQIIRTALLDLGQEADNSKTLYQLIHLLEKVVLNK